MVDLLDAWEVGPVFKWVDDFNFMHEPCSAIMHDDSSMDYSYAYDLCDIICLMDRLGIPWHPIDKKGHDFSFLATYVVLCRPALCPYLGTSMKNML